MQDPLTADRVVAVDGIAASAVVAVVGSIGIEDVVDGVFEAFHREHGAPFASFAGVVKDHIEDDFDACFMEFPHQSFELLDLGTGLFRVRVASVRGKECKRIVAPVVLVLVGLPVEVQNREFMDRKEFDGRHTEVFDIGDFLDSSEVGSRLGHPARWVFGQACNMHFVENGVLDRDFRWSIGLPVESVVDRHAFRGTDDAIGGCLEVSSKGIAIGVDQASIAIEPQPVFGSEGSVGLEMVQLSGTEVGQESVPYIADFVVAGIEFDRLGRFAVIDARVEQDPHRRGRLAEDREVDTVWIAQGTEGGLVAV